MTSCSSGPSKNCEYQLPHRMDPLSWEAISGHRIHILLLAIELKDYCGNIKAFGHHVRDFKFFSDSSLEDTSANKSCPSELFSFIIQLYIRLPLKIKYKHLYLHLLQSPSSYFFPVKQAERNVFWLNNLWTNQVIQCIAKIFEVHFKNFLLFFSKNPNNF